MSLSLYWPQLGVVLAVSGCWREGGKGWFMNLSLDPIGAIWCADGFGTRSFQMGRSESVESEVNGDACHAPTH